MIAVALLAAAATAPIAPAPLAPPLGATIRYRLSDLRFQAGAPVRTENMFALLFERADGRLVARETVTEIAIDAAAPVRASFEALLRPFVGIAVRVTLDGDGQPDALIDAAPTLAAYHASLAAFDASLATRVDLTRSEQAELRATVARDAALPPAHFVEAAAGLLPPAVPPLRVGEASTFITRDPEGDTSARGTLTLVASDAARLRYRLVVESAPELRTTSEWEVARDTGLLVRFAVRRERIAPGGEHQQLYTRRIERVDR